MANRQKKNLAKRRRRRTLIPCKSNEQAIRLKNNIQKAIPDKDKQQKYIAVLIDGLVVTCPTCDEKLLCDKRYEDCQYNPANEVD